MAAFFADDMQRSSPNLNLHTSTNNKFWFVEASTLVRTKWHRDLIWVLMLSTRHSMPQEQAA